MRDDGIRKYDIWSGYLTKANIEEVRLRLEEMFTGKLVTIYTNRSWSSTGWGELRTGLTLSSFKADSRADVPSSELLLTCEGGSYMYMWGTRTENQAEATLYPDLDTPSLRFENGRFYIKSKSPSGHILTHAFAVQLDRDGEAQCA